MMYREPQTYEDIVKVIVDIYLDYGIKGFPLDEHEICRKLGVSLVPYSEILSQASIESETEEHRALLCKEGKGGFFVKGSLTKPPTIYYNDKAESRGFMRFSIFHEVKHYVFNEDSDDNDEDDLADFFSRFFQCPIPFLIMKGIKSENEIVSRFGLSLQAAENVVSNLENRLMWHGKKIFDHEIPLVQHLDNTAYQVYVNAQLRKRGGHIEGVQD